MTRACVAGREESITRTAARRGVTLLELLIVLTLITIVAGWALPRIDLAKFRADAAGRVVRATLQQAQRLAILRQYDVAVGIDTIGRRLRIHEDTDNDGVVDTGERVRWRPIEEGVRFAAPPVGVSGTAGGAVTGTNIRTVAGLPTLIFRRDGSASTDAEIYVVGAVDRPTSFRAITVVQSTGRADWHRYRAPTWIRGGA